MSATKWRIPTLTRADGMTIKVWKPREFHFEDAEHAMKVFNEKNVVCKLKNGLKSTDDIMMVIRQDGDGSEEYTNAIMNMLLESEPIEVQSNEANMNAFLKETKKYPKEYS